MMRGLFATVFAALAAVPALATPTRVTRRQDDNSFSVAEDQDLITFEYSTSSQDDTNWIGLFNPGKGPENGEQNEEAVAWDYAKDASGALYINVDYIDPGSYDAYFLSADGYESLDDSTTVDVSFGPLHFIPSKGITLKSARAGDEYEAKVGGLIGKLDTDTGVEFSISSAESGDWASISKDGVISGTPSEGGQTAKLTVTATTSSESADLEMSIPVVETDSALVSDFVVLTYNLWHRGTSVHNHREKQIRFLAEANIDFLAVQESDEKTLKGMADALGWDYYQGTDSHDTGIASRYPFAEVYPEWSNGVSARLDFGGKEVNAWGTHLGYDPYGPYDFCFDKLSGDEVLENEEESGRTPQIKDAMTNMKEHIDNADDIPVILCGDFNAPSQLDWTEATADSHCGVGDFEWPSSKAPLDAGLIDAVRELYPDPVEEPFITWSPVYKDNDGREEPMDRIDFVYFKGGLTPTAAEAVVQGEPEEQPNHQENEWTSDHRAVKVTFSI